MPYDPAIESQLLKKVKRAKKHIQDLETALSGFPHSGDDFIRCENDLQKRERRYYCTALPIIPPDIPLIAGDIIQNLCSALDHLACRLLRSKCDTQTYFPICSTEIKYKASKRRGKIEEFRPDVIKFIDLFKPYEGGDYLLWELHELNRIDKHRLLLTVCATDIARSMNKVELSTLQEVFRQTHPESSILRSKLVYKESIAITPLKIGEKFHTVPHSEMDEEMKFLIGIAFDESKIIKGKTIIELLLKMHESVQAVIISLSRAGVL
jgi:hypothetical protein